jgi:hypothetical protein
MFPIYTILEKPGLNTEQLYRLSTYISHKYNISKEKIKINDGILEYDDNDYKTVPILNISKDEIQFTTKNEDNLFDTIDISNLKNIKIMPQDIALKHAWDIIKNIDLSNNSLEINLESSNETLSIVFSSGYLTEEYKITTKIVGRFYLNKIPIEGPGVKFIVTFNNTEPIYIFISMSTYNLSNENIYIIDNSESKQKFIEYNNIKIKEHRLFSKLIYYAPKYNYRLSYKTGIYPIKKILPTYIVGGEFLIDEQILKFTQTYVNACNSYEYIGIIQNMNIETIQNYNGMVSIVVICKIISKIPLRIIKGVCNNITDSIDFYSSENITIPINKNDISYIDNNFKWVFNITVNNANNTFISISAIDIIGNEFKSNSEKLQINLDKDIIIPSIELITKNTIIQYPQNVYFGHGNTELFVFDNKIVNLFSNFNYKNVSSICYCIPNLLSNNVLNKWSNIIDKTGIICGFLSFYHNEIEFITDFNNFQNQKNIRKSWCHSNDINQPSNSIICIIGLLGVNTFKNKTDILINYNENLQSTSTELIKQNICGYWIYKSYN